MNNGDPVLRSVAEYPGFLAKVATTVENVTGDTTIYPVVPETEIFDNLANYDHTTGVFTVPLYGRYRFTARINLTGIAANHTPIALVIVTSNRLYYGYDTLQLAVDRSIEVNCIADMDAEDTAFMRLLGYGGAKTIDVYGDANMTTYFCGNLVC